MMKIVRYAWKKRAKLWIRRGVIVLASARLLIRTQYRFAGWVGRYVQSIGPSLRAASVSASGDRYDLMKSVNPFIEYEIGRLGLKPSSIGTMMRETYSQCNEDLIIESLLRAKLFDSGRQMCSARYLEVGGNHPVQTSSTYLLYRVWGAKGWIVEASGVLAARLRDTRPRDVVIESAVSDKSYPFASFHVHERDELSSLSLDNIKGFASTGLIGEVLRVESVPNIHINALFSEHIDCHLDFMSIDIEGMDLPVLKAMNPLVRPTVLQVECVDVELLREFRETLEPRGYQIAAITEVNVIFVQK